MLAKRFETPLHAEAKSRCLLQPSSVPDPSVLDESQHRHSTNDHATQTTPVCDGLQLQGREGSPATQSTSEGQHYTLYCMYMYIYIYIYTCTCALHKWHGMSKGNNIV